MPDEAMIVVKNASRRFGKTTAIDDVSLIIRKGELFGILGPDGAGKTTLLRMIAAVLDPSGPPGTDLRDLVTAISSHVKPADLRAKVRDVITPVTGHVTVGGHDTVSDSEAVKAIQGYMPQAFGLYGDLSVVENLAFAADVHGIHGQEREDRSRKLLAFAGLEQFRTRRAALLSGGMKKKLALACALLHRPAVLLLDEPTTGVDPVARREFWDLLSGLHAEGITTVVSTPYMDEAERCNRVVLLYHGRLLAYGTPQEIKSQIPGHVLALQTPDVSAATSALTGLPGLLELQTYGDQLNLIVDDDAQQMQDAIHARLQSHNITVHDLSPMPMRMEEAFIYLVNTAHQEATGGAA
jgi:ABC-2 type transport system ATP-binding protein